MVKVAVNAYSKHTNGNFVVWLLTYFVIIYESWLCYHPRLLTWCAASRHHIRSYNNNTNLNNHQTKRKLLICTIPIIIHKEGHSTSIHIPITLVFFLFYLSSCPLWNLHWSFVSFSHLFYQVLSFSIISCIKI